MKSFFSVKTILSDLREISPEAIAMLSLEDLYNLLLESIDLVRFSRISQEQTRRFSRLNRGMMEITPSFSNVGGLIPITVKTNPVTPLSEIEKENLDFLISTIVSMKRELVEDRPLTNFGKEKIKITLTPISKVTKRKKSKQNRHYFRLRQNK